MSETPPLSGRSSTFDSRYRYDHIYPRGRSGETLRAWDIQDNERPVVIKRPAPQDAPPMRAAQQVSIGNERKSLERLTGHPVLTELRGVGTFRVGNQTHDYVVMDRAEGDIIADLVLELAEHGERLPMLEMLEVVDRLLDLLILAHDQQIVYNDVDAKHLFWDREHYRLKVIDWGNAVLLDEGGSQGITRQTDIYQVGELLYFIVSGGKRLDSETTSEGEHAILFGMDAVHVSATLKNVITQATHPNIRKRYSTIAELRKQLDEIRKPLEDRRNKQLADVEHELDIRNSHQELEALLEELDKAVALDPGYPKSHQLYEAVHAKIHRLELQSNIDAGRIYLDTANWSRAIETMLGLLEEADSQIAPVIRFIIATAELLETRGRTDPPSALLKATDELLHGDPQEAGIILSLEAENDSSGDHDLIAERLATLIPSVNLLRPHLAKLKNEVGELANQSEIHDSIEKIYVALNQQPDFPNLSNLLSVYQDVGRNIEQLKQQITDVDTSGGRLLEIAVRSEQALQIILNHFHTISTCAYGDPTRAGQSLRIAKRIDPLNPYFDELNDYFDEVHQAIKALSSFKPKADGSDLGAWYERVLNFLQPYGDDLQDQALHNALGSLKKASELWKATLEAFILGSRSSAIGNLNHIFDLMQPLNQHIGSWAKQLIAKAENSDNIELISPNITLAQKLIEGYKIWDQGKLERAASLAQQMEKYAETDGERLAVQRLHQLGDIVSSWLKKDGVGNYDRTDQAEKAIVGLFLSEEENELDRFAAQMPSTETYLKVMGRGLVEGMRESSTAAIRILFIHYVLRGMLCVLEKNLEDADFWREAALKAIVDGRSNPAFAEFDTLLTARKLVLEAEAVLQNVHEPKDIASVRALLNQPLADQWLSEIQRGIRHLEVAIRNWEDGDFRSSRDALDATIEELEAGEKQSNIDLNTLLGWVKPLREGAAALQASRLKLEQISHSITTATSGQETPTEAKIDDLLTKIVLDTENYLGADHSHQVRQWLSTYQAVRGTHTNTTFTKGEKLIAFDAHFAGLFISKHPAYRLFQTWRDAVQKMPDDLADLGDTESQIEQTSSEHRVNILAEDDGLEVETPDAPSFFAPPRDVSSEDPDSIIPDDDIYYEEGMGNSNIPWTTLVTVAIVIIGVIAFALFVGFGEDDDDPIENTSVAISSSDATLTQEAENLMIASETTAVTSTNTAIVATSTTTVVPTEFTPTPEPTDAPTLPPTETVTPQPTITLDPGMSIGGNPSATMTPNANISPTTISNVPTTNSPTSGLPNFPQDVLRQFSALSAAEYDWDLLWFRPGAGGPWTLGASTANAGDGLIIVTMSPEFLDLQYGNGAGERLRAVEAVMELTVPAPDDLSSEVFFGLGLENPSGQRTSAEVRIPQGNSIVLGVTENGSFRQRTIYTPTTYRVTIRVERDNDGTLIVEVDGQRLMDLTATQYGDGIALSPVLYTSGGGVFVVVSEMEFEFDPISVP